MEVQLWLELEEDTQWEREGDVGRVAPRSDVSSVGRDLEGGGGGCLLTKTLTIVATFIWYYEQR